MNERYNEFSLVVQIHRQLLLTRDGQPGRLVDKWVAIL